MQVHIPSPVEELIEPLFKEKGIQVFLKRDDLIHPIISGNKWRKLKYPLQQAALEGKKTIITFGGAFSNHLLATAEAAKLLGFTAIGIVRGEEQSNATLNYCRSAGMHLLFVSRTEYQDKEACIKRYTPKTGDVLVLPEGGATAQGVAGCKEILAECDQTFDHVFCAAGTGTTATGLYSYIKAEKLHSVLHVVPVLKGGEFIRHEIERYLATDTQLVLHTQQHCGGYGKTNPELLHFIHHFYQKQGLLLDQVYTGKMMFGLYQLIEQGHFKKGSTILAIHTGGLSGLLGIRAKLLEIDPLFTQILASIDPN